MRIVIDTDKATLSAGGKNYSLYGAEAFRILSREWLGLGWNLGHWETFSWMGRQLLQFPDDVLRLGEAVWCAKPDVLVETGVYDGGSALLFATLCRMCGGGRVVAVEKDIRTGVREALCGLVTLIEGDSAAPATIRAVADQVPPGARVFVFLDSDHTKDHVADELAAYAPFVTPGSYIVVADTNLANLAGLPNGERCWRHDNPHAAVESFLAANPQFVADPPARLFANSCDLSVLSYFSSGWLRRV